MKLTLILIFAFITMCTYSQSDCDITKEYQEIFKISKTKHGENEYLMKNIKKVDKNHCFSELINENDSFFDYLQTHFSDRSHYKEFLAISDSVELQKEFIKSLELDSTFNSVMTKLNQKVFNSSNFIPDTVSIDEMLNIAVKFFSIVSVTDGGEYSIRFCTGINGLKQTEKVRNPHLEAFCFSSLLKNYQGEQFNMYDEFVKGVKEVYKFNLGIDPKDRLLRAQGALYMFMRNNEALNDLILFEYENKKQYLPFVLVEN